MIRHIDNDYELISGYPRVATIYDWHARAYCEVVLTDIGRSGGVAADPDKQLQRERMPVEGTQRAVWLAQKRAEDAQRRARLVAHIREHGPVYTNEAGEILGVKYPTQWLHARRDVFVVVGKHGHWRLYGLREEVR